MAVSGLKLAICLTALLRSFSCFRFIPVFPFSNGFGISKAFHIVFYEVPINVPRIEGEFY